MITPGRGSAYSLERAVLFLTLLSVMFPLSTSVGTIGIALFGLPLATLLFLWALRGTLRPTTNRWLSGWDVGVLLLVVWMGLTTFLNDQAELPRFTIWASAFLLAFYARHNWGRVFDFRLLGTFATTAVMIQVTVGLTQLLTQSRFGSVQDYFGQLDDSRHPWVLLPRMVGTVGAPNLYGNWLVVLLPFVALPFLRPRGGATVAARSVALAAAALSFLCLTINVTRMNIAVAMLTVFLMWIVVRRTSRQTHAPTGRELVGSMVRPVLSLLLASAVVFAVLNLIEERLLGFSSAAAERIADTDRHLGLRMQQYRGALEAVADRPLVGVGFGGSAGIWDTVDAALPRGFTYAPHNVYLIIATEGGLPALALFFGILILPLRRYWSHGIGRDSSLDALAFCVLSFLMVFMTYVVPIGHGIWPLFAFLLGALYAASRDPVVATAPELADKTVSRRSRVPLTS